jgi:antitoxin component of MazEF toxin-antitoxin module
MEIRKLRKDGKSLVLSIPPSYLTNLNLSIGDRVTIVLTTDRKIVITKLELNNQGAQC